MWERKQEEVLGKNEDVVKIDDIEKNHGAKSGGWIVFLIFIWIWMSVPLGILGMMWWSGDMSLWFIPAIFLIIGIAFIIYVITKKKFMDRLHKHIDAGTIIVQKAEIIQFKYFSSRNNNDLVESWYYIIATIWDKKYKSEGIKVWLFWAQGKNIDKEYYLKMGIPFWPNDPNYNDWYKRQVTLKTKEIENKIRELSEQFKYASWFEKYKIKNSIQKLQEEASWLSPYALPYKWKLYYIWDEIDVYIDPDNHWNYMMWI